MTSRRKFLKHGTFGALAAGFSLGLGNKVSGHAGAFASSKALGLNSAAFESQLHTVFLVNDGDRKVPLKLTEVIDLKARRSISTPGEAFTLVLCGSTSSPLEQGTYSIEHEKLGGFSLLIVPVLSRDKSARYYEININRLHR